MASDDKKTKADPVQKTKADPASKSDAPKKDKSTADAKSTGDATSSADAAPAKASEKEAGSPSGYHRGEGQKPVTQAYKDNWNLIFGEKKKKR